ncbi:MAG: DUF983 domain-containing protein [Rhodospirillales bacterium]|nr:DUF983 domain-containing protein [Rhodospirillales bacterium]
MGEEGYHPRISPVGAGLRCKCPRCGRGRLFHGYLTVAGACESCGLDLEKADSGDGPAVFIIFILGFLVVPLALLFEAWFAPPYWLHMAIWPAVILGGALALLRPLKGLMIALQFHHKASESGTQRYD